MQLSLNIENDPHGNVVITDEIDEKEIKIKKQSNKVLSASSKNLNQLKKQLKQELKNKYLEVEFNPEINAVKNMQQISIANQNIKLSDTDINDIISDTRKQSK